MANHGVYTSRVDSGLSTPNEAASGIPFVIGVAPLASVDADTRAQANVPFLATSYKEAVDHLGYDDDWVDYTLCEVMYYHFLLAQSQPVIFLPLTETIDTQQFNGDGTVKEFTVTAKPPRIHDVKVGTVDAEVASYDPATGKVTLKVAPVSGTNNVTVSYVTLPTAATVAAAVEKIDLCMPMFGVIPDMILAPGFSHEATVAAAMVAKIGAVNGMFHGKALVDLDAESYTAAITAKNGGTFVKDQIVCWPMAKLGDLTFHASTILAGRLAQTDNGNDGVPYESPSNKAVAIDSLVSSSGNEIILTLAQANLLNAAGICTFLNFIDGWKAWGNYTGCAPADTDVKNYQIPVARMFDWVGNTLIKTFWSKLDLPMNRRLIDTILDSANIWIDGLVGSGYLLGGRVEMLESENPVSNLMAGIIKLHVYMTPPSPAQEIDFALEYDASFVQSALQG